MKKMQTTQQLSLHSLSILHINTNSAHLEHRHSNEILCASTLFSLFLSPSFSLSLCLSHLTRFGNALSFCLSVASRETVTLTWKQVLLLISCACLYYYAFASICLIDLISSSNDDKKRKSFVRCLIHLII